MAKRKQRIVHLAILLVLAMGVVYTLWLLPQLQLGELSLSEANNKEQIDIKIKQAELEDKFRASLAQIYIGLGLLVSLYFVWRRISVSEKQTEITHVGQLSDQYTEAVEKLNDEKSEVKLSAILTLERLARDSERHHWLVIEVLTTFIRENSKIDGKVHLEADKCINTAFKVILMRERYIEPDRIDLSGALLANQTVRGLSNCMGLSGAKLSKVNLRNADLPYLSFEGASLDATLLEGANLTKTNFEGAFMFQANLESANLEGANLRCACVSFANLKNASLKGANLAYVNFTDANLEGANLEGVNLKGANLTFANLADANLEGAILKGARIPYTSFKDANFKGVRPTKLRIKKIFRDNKYLKSAVFGRLIK